MHRLFKLLSLLWIAVTFAQCGGGGGDPPASSGPAPAPAVPVAAVRMTYTAVGLGVGQTVVLKAEALAADGAVLPGRSFMFASSNAAVATVSVARAGADTATVTGMAVGGATVTATVDGKVGTTGVTIFGAPLENIPVTGRVIDGDSRAGIAGATVAYGTDNGQSGTAITAADGSFSFAFASDARSGAYVVDATASAQGYRASTLRGARVRPSGTQIESLQLVRERVQADSTVSGKVLDVRTGQVIAGASLRLEHGQGVTNDPSPYPTTSDAQGRFTFNGVAAGTYTVIATAAGYTQGARTVVSVAPGADAMQNIGLSPVGEAPEVRIILNWGRVPADLDAHLTGPNVPGATGRFHAYFLNRLAAGAAPYAGLDLDDRDGYGPETITLTRLNGGVYRYSVHDYTNHGATSPTHELGRSGATVQVIAGGRTTTFHVPVQPGNLWTVFELSGDIANPVITERGEMGVTEDFNTIP